MSVLTLLPRVSEKAYGLSKDRNVYVFDVDTSANKQAIAEAVESQFSVTVESVNVSVAKGKRKRNVRRSGRATFGTRKNVKRAYVTIKAGDHIPVFAAIDEASDAKTAPKKEKK
ncbi:50S ribosomal protein L23 [soil metagenome]